MLNCINIFTISFDNANLVMNLGLIDLHISVELSELCVYDSLGVESIIKYNGKFHSCGHGFNGIYISSFQCNSKLVEDTMWLMLSHMCQSSDKKGFP